MPTLKVFNGSTWQVATPINYFTTAWLLRPWKMYNGLGWDVIANGLASAPTGFVSTGMGEPYYYGKRWYQEAYFEWNNPTALPWQIYESLTDDVDAGAEQGSGSSGTTWTQTKQTGASEYYYFIRFTDPMSEWTTSGVGPIQYQLS